MTGVECACRYDVAGVITDLCDQHYRSYMEQVERRMNCSNGICGE